MNAVSPEATASPHHTLARLRLPPAPDVAGLYIQSGRTAPADPGRLRPGQNLGLGTYFNSWYEGIFDRHCDVGPLRVAVVLAGDFTLTLTRRVPGAPPEIIAVERARGARPELPVTIAVPPPAPGREGGRLCLDIRCDGGEGVFSGGRVETATPPRPVLLAVGVCTYRREETAAGLIRRLLDDPELERLGVLVYVADNGRTLRLKAHPRLSMLPGPNLGGSGGFSRVMREVLRQGRATHLMLLDDDVDCDPESVLRTASFYRYARHDAALAGCMLDARRRLELFEAGAVLGENTVEGVGSPINVRSLGHGRSLDSQEALDAFLSWPDFDYGGFWLFAMPVSFIRRLGLLLPFFLNGDDIEFNLRIRSRLGAPVVVLPPVGVWHAPFYGKFTLSGHYLWVRNLLAVHTLQATSTPWLMVLQLAGAMFRELCLYRYQRVFLLTRAVEDWLRGPAWLDATPALPRARAVEAEALARYGEPLAAPACDGAAPATADGPLSRALRLATLGGHLLPAFLQSADPAILDTGGGQWRKSFRHLRARIVNVAAGTCQEFRLRNGVGLRAYARGLWTLLRAGLAYPELRRRWIAAAPAMCAPEAWERREAEAERGQTPTAAS